MGFTFHEQWPDEISAYFERFDTFALDLETTGLNPHDSRIVMCQIGFPDDTQFVIDARKTKLDALLPYLYSRKWTKIFFNGEFEGKFFLKNYDTDILHVFDCYIAERIVHPDNLGGNSFEDLALKYLDVQLDKQTRKSFLGGQSGPFTEKQIRYGAEDVKYLFPLMEILQKDLEDKELTHIADLENDVVSVVAAMELEGVPVDSEKWLSILQEYIEEHEESRKALLSLLTGKPTENFEKLGTQTSLFDDDDKDLLPNTLNLNSPIQVTKALASVGVHVKDTSEQTIALIKHPAAEELTRYRGLQKLISSYGQEAVLDKIHPFTGRIHPDWRQLGAETGRFSCRNPNLQQVPPKLRKAIGGVENYSFLGADFSQMELRILAQESKDPILVDSFTNNKDVHTITASLMFNTPIEKVTKEQRFVAKTLNFGITYGMQIGKFSDMLNIEAKKDGRPPVTMGEARNLIELYKRTYKVAGNYLESLGLLALRDGWVQTRFGRKRWFNPITTNTNPKAFKGQVEAIKRAGANMPIQGGNADITKMALIEIYSELREYGFRANIILQVHDEIVLLAHNSQVESIIPIVEGAMVRAGKRLLPDIPVVVESYASPYWPK